MPVLFPPPSYISFSQLMTYVRCPEHYLFRYMLGIKRPPTKAMIRGSAIHDTLASDYIQKKNRGFAMKEREAQELYENLLAQHMEKYKKGLGESSFLLTKEFLQREENTSVSELLDAGTRGIRAYKREVERKTEPVLVEASFGIPMSKDMEIVGRIDLADTSSIVHETKTAKKKPALQDVASDPQIAFYILGYEALTGQRPKSMVKDFIIFQKLEASIVRYPVVKSSIDQKTLFRYIKNVLQAIKQNVWYCLHPADSWICSKEWCGYWKLHKELRRLGLPKFVEKYGTAKT